MNRFIKEAQMKALETVKKALHDIGAGVKAFFADAKKRTIFIISVVSILALTLIIALSFHIYVSDYYEADYQAISEVAELSNTDIYMLRGMNHDTIVFDPKNAKTGFIFYPGGKVEYESYAPLMDALASKGILAIMVKMPYNLAILAPNAAEGITDKFPEIENWYIGGHSLGGVVAATYLKNHPNEIDGLILLGGYSTDNVKDSRVLCIYGSEDRVMNKEKYESSKKNLPEDFTEVVIAGGNHSGFGMYGHQEGDGWAEITKIDQIIATAEAIKEFTNN